MCRTIALTTLTAATYIGIPLFFRNLLKGDIHVILLLLTSLLRFISITLSSKFKHSLPLFIKGFSRFIYMASGFIIAFVTITGLLITPYSAYRIWFNAIGNNSQHGVVSNLLVLISLFFITGIDFYSNSLPQSILLLATIVSGILTITYQTIYFILVFFFFVLAVFLYRFLKGMNVYPRMFFNPLSFIILAFGISWISSIAYVPSGSRVVDNQLHPVLRQIVVSLFPRFPLLYGLPGYGSSFNTTRLGRTPVLSQAPIFRVTMKNAYDKRQIYLRTSVYDYYTGIGWENTTKQNNRENTENIIIVNEPDKKAHVTMTIEIVPEYYYLIPHTIQTTKIWLKTKTPPGKISGSRDDGFLLEKPLTGGDRIYLKEENNFDMTFLTNSEKYLQVPLETSKKLHSIAAALSDKDSIPNTLKSIGEYLASNCIYSLKSSVPGRGAGFVTDFLLTTRRGYCTHFASSFVILARLCGIPARYVSGFLIYPTGNDTVTGLQAHAWPEVYLPQKGWVTWEATPAVLPDNYEFRNKSIRYNFKFNRDTLTERQILYILGKKGFSFEQRRNKRLHSIKYLKLFFYTLTIAIILVVLFIKVLPPFTIWLASVSGFLRISSAARIIASKMVLRKLARTTLGAKRKNLMPIDYSGWSLWIRKVVKEIEKQAPKKRKNTAIKSNKTKEDLLTRIILEILYSNHPITVRGVKYIALFYRKYLQ